MNSTSRRECHWRSVVQGLSLTPGFSRVWEAEDNWKTVSTVSFLLLKTVETVLTLFPGDVTPLKRCANERSVLVLPESLRFASLRP